MRFFGATKMLEARHQTTSSNKHDTILFYQASGKRTFNIQRKQLAESTIKRYAKYFDANGQITYERLRDTNPGVFRKLKGIPEDLAEYGWISTEAVH